MHSHFRVKPNRCVVLCWGWGFDNSDTRETYEKIVKELKVIGEKMIDLESQ